METILITGTSGFIGFHLAKNLLKEGKKIIGLDCENDYYDVRLKQARRAQLEKSQNFSFYKISLEDFTGIKKIFQENKIDRVCNLAAQAGVRYSISNPFAYIQSNLVGFANIIELAKEYKVKNFVYASSSSVYGKNEKIPFAVEDVVDHPISLYAATKKSNELIAHSYSHLFGLPTTGLRFFTVYGPWGRPDMATFIFTDKISKGEEIQVYNHGKMKRDFTYIDDIVEGIMKALDAPSPYEIFNLGNHDVVELEYMIATIEKELGKEAKKKYMDIQPGDVLATWADIAHTKKKLHREPRTKIEDGMKNFVARYREFYDTN